MALVVRDVLFMGQSFFLQETKSWERQWISKIYNYSFCKSGTVRHSYFPIKS